VHRVAVLNFESVLAAMKIAPRDAKQHQSTPTRCVQSGSEMTLLHRRAKIQQWVWITSLVDGPGIDSLFCAPLMLVSMSIGTSFPSLWLESMSVGLVFLEFVTLACFGESCPTSTSSQRTLSCHGLPTQPTSLTSGCTAGSDSTKLITLTVNCFEESRST